VRQSGTARDFRQVSVVYQFPHSQLAWPRTSIDHHYHQQKFDTKSITPSTRRQLDSVAVPVPHRSTEPARPRHRAPDTPLIPRTGDAGDRAHRRGPRDDDGVHAPIHPALGRQPPVPRPGRVDPQEALLRRRKPRHFRRLG
jgi:hypothetical protein